jgi:hypothetical protein
MSDCMAGRRLFTYLTALSCIQSKFPHRITEACLNFLKQETAQRATSVEKISYWPGAEMDLIFMTHLPFQVALAAAHVAAPRNLSMSTISSMTWW